MNLSNLPPGVSNYDIEEAAGAFELDDEERCQLFIDLDIRCPNPWAYVVREPFTPAGFKRRVCPDCAKSQVEQGYILSPSPEWSFPELTEEQNTIITKARLYGYAGFFPCVNGGTVQAENTLAGAKEFLANRRKK